jgi:hypothetical protein
MGGMPPEMMGGMPPESAMGGIGALPTDQGPAPDMGAPVMMAAGGYVQSFSEGSDEDGVTPAGDTSSYASSFSPDVVNNARQYVLNTLSKQPIAAPDLATEVEKRTPLYEKLLGVDKNLSQAQILFELGQRAFNYGANVDDQGRPLYGSQMARLAGAVRTLPGAVGNIAGQMEQQKRAVRSAALQATEKDIQTIREQNAKLVESQRKTYTDILKSSNMSLFGKGDWQWNVVNKPGLLSSWVENKTSPEQDTLIESAITELGRPRIETRKDPVTGNDYQVSIPGVLPPFVKEAIALKGFDTSGGSAGTTQKPRGSGAPMPAEAPGQVYPEGDLSYLEGKDPGPRINVNEFPGMPQDTSRRPAASVYKNQADPLKVNPGLQNYYEDPQKRKTLYNQSVGTGLVPGITSTAYGIPLVGSFLGEDAAELSAKRKNLENVGLNISKGVAQNPRFAEGERNFIQNTLQLLPTYFDRPQAYAQRVFAFDSYLLGLQEEALKNSYNTQLPADVRQAARAKSADIHSVRMNVGAPIRIQDANDPRVLQLPSGTYYLFQDKDVYQKE